MLQIVVLAKAVAVEAEPAGAERQVVEDARKHRLAAAGVVVAQKSGDVQLPSVLLEQWGELVEP